jgi:hypothetical protein
LVPEVLLAEPVLARSREEADELAEETPEEEKVCGNVSNPCSEQEKGNHYNRYAELWTWSVFQTVSHI